MPCRFQKIWSMPIGSMYSIFTFVWFTFMLDLYRKTCQSHGSVMGYVYLEPVSLSSMLDLGKLASPMDGPEVRVVLPHTLVSLSSKGIICRLKVLPSPTPPTTDVTCWIRCDMWRFQPGICDEVCLFTDVKNGFCSIRFQPDALICILWGGWFFVLGFLFSIKSHGAQGYLRFAGIFFVDWKLPSIPMHLSSTHIGMS